MLRRAVRLLSFSLVAFSLLAAAGVPGSPGKGEGNGPVRRPPTPEERRQVRGGESRPLHAALSAPVEPMLSPGAQVDVERYFLDLKVTPSTQRLDGTARVVAKSLSDGLTSVTLGLFSQMTINAVQASAGGALPFSRSGDLVTVTLSRPHASGETIDFTLAYGGQPATAGYGAFTFRTHNGGTQPIISSLSEPTYAPVWWPCLDDPADKAIVEMDLNVPSGLVGVSNGLLSATLDKPDGTRTYQWRSSYPISTYLVSVAISNYATFASAYPPVTGGPPMLVQHWVYPEHLAAAQQDFSVTVPMLTYFSGLFGEYPFVNEKYGHAIFNFGGGMEHQTVSSYGVGLIRGDNTFDWVVAHELAHQWFGDGVTLAAWPEIWLNEGFATYAEARWWEHLYGAAGLKAYMASLDSRPFCGTVYNPAPACDLFGKTVYDKGAWVLHMLRRVVGESAFSEGVRNYVADFKYGNASTQDLRVTMESASGLALTPFFTRWVYQPGEPSYRWGWTAAQTPAGWVTHVRIEQTQAGGLFEMPVDLRVVGPGGSVTVTVPTSLAGEDFALPPVPQQPTQVTFDPDLWILKSAAQITLADADADGVPDTADNCGALANPAQEDLDGDLLGDLCDPDRDGDGRDNGADCAPDEASAQDPPASISGLDAAAGPEITLQWDTAPGHGSGTTYDLVRGDPGLLADESASGALCLAVGLEDAGASDPSALAPGTAFFYLVRARNACGSGDLGNDSSGAPRLAPACP